MSIRVRSLALLMGCTLVPLGLLAFASYGKLIGTLSESANNVHLVYVHDKALTISSAIKQVEGLSLQIIADPLFREALLERTNPLIGKPRLEAELSARISGLGLFGYVRGRNGLVVRSALPFFGLDPETERTILETDTTRVWNIERVGVAGEQSDLISLSRRIVDIEDIFNTLGAMKVSVPLPISPGVLGSPPGGSAWIVADASGRPLFSNPPGWTPTEESAARLLDASIAFERGWFADGGRQVFFDHLETGWILAWTAPARALPAESNAILAFVLIAIVLSAFLSFLFSLILYRKIVSPLATLGARMRSLGQDDLGRPLEANSGDEIATLYESFNLMTSRIRGLLSDVYASGTKQREAELSALQARINPHFLFNTLDAIFWKCRLEGALVSSEMVRDLSSLFRYNLDARTLFSTLRQELDYLKRYFSLLERRYEGGIRFIGDVPEELLDVSVLRFAFQPVVENAVIHGIQGAGGKGEVIFSARADSGRLICTVSDDGMGIDEEEIAGLLESAVAPGTKGFAVRNVNERLRLLFGEGYGLRFRRGRPAGTVAEISQPLMEAPYDPAAPSR